MPMDMYPTRSLPAALLSTDSIVLDLAERSVPIPLCRKHFTSYTGPDLTHLRRQGPPPRGRPPPVRRGGHPPPLPSRRLAGPLAGDLWPNGKLTPGLWNAWHPDGPRAQEHLPIEEAWVNERLHAIAIANGGTFSGCWDVVAWPAECGRRPPGLRGKQEAQEGPDPWYAAAVVGGSAEMRNAGGGLSGGGVECMIQEQS
jgi:hypothetical protein